MEDTRHDDEPKDAFRKPEITKKRSTRAVRAPRKEGSFAKTVIDGNPIWERALK